MLVLIVGPSGAGKDTLLDAARAKLDGNHDFRFARRLITRAPASGGEDNIRMSRPEFDAMKASGQFFLWWEAHGLGYGISSDIAVDLASGRTVVASVSRGVIAEARARTRTQVIEITAPPDVLAARLAERGREGAVDIAARLARTVARPDDDQALVIMNNGTIAEGAAKLIRALRRAAES